MTVYLVGAGPGRPRAADPPGGRAPGPGRRRRLRPAGRPLAARPRAAGGRADRRGQAARRGSRRARAVRRRSTSSWSSTGGRGRAVVRLKGGDPFLFGRGGEEAEALTAGRGALGGRARRVLGLRRPGCRRHPGHPPGPVDLGHRRDRAGGRPDGARWRRLGGPGPVGGTLVMLMGMATRAEIAERAPDAAARPADTRWRWSSGGPPRQQRVVRTTLDRLAEVELGSPAVIVVGPVAALGPTGPRWPAGSALWPAARWWSPDGARGPRAWSTRSQRAGAAAIERRPDAHRPSRRRRGGLCARPRQTLAAYRLGRLHLGQRRAPVHARAARRPGLGPASAGRGGSGHGRRPATAGIEPDLVPAEHRRPGTGRRSSPRPTGRAGRLGPLPVRRPAPSTSPTGLGAKGWEVRRGRGLPHRAGCPPPDPAVRTRWRRADAVIFTAPSSVQAFAALHGPDGAPAAGAAGGRLHRSDHGRRGAGGRHGRRRARHRVRLDRGHRRGPASGQLSRRS